ncbi:MAG: hypothetical protein QOG31_1291 [Thermoplasmata archaeon]|jgi:hypothetical protein|nr:hypothetical protein [Thermoplasmata archaeon]
MGRAGQCKALLGLLLAFAGCIEPAHTNPPPSSSLPFPVEPGTSILFEPVPAPDIGFSLEVRGNYDYGVAGPRTEDSYECSALLTAKGWQPTLDPRPPPITGQFVARRQDGQTTWAGIMFAHAQGKFPIGIGGRDPGISILVGHDQVGPYVTSNLTVRPEEGTIRRVQDGRFWCLDSLSRFTEGSYLATETKLDAQGLAWEASFNTGLLLRFENSATVTGLKLDGPDGTHPAPQGADLTFCSPIAGHWRLGIDSLQADTAWSLVVKVFDARLPGFPCTGAWVKSPDGSTNAARP